MPILTSCMHSLFLLLLTLFISTSNSTPLLLTLTHSLSNSSHSLLHHLNSSSHLSTSRHLHRHRRSSNNQVSLPLSPGSDYTLSISLSPSKTTTLYLDTGSDLVWFPCTPFECILCENKPKPSPTPPPKDSHPVPCSSTSCTLIHSSQTSSDLCAASGCPLADLETNSCTTPCPNFYYAYGDGSLIGHLRRGPLSLPVGPGSSKTSTLSLKSFTFACAHTALAEPIGVAGFGRGPLSLPAQLSKLSPDFSARFSYCLISHSFEPNRLIKPSPLILGRTEPGPSLGSDRGKSFIYTPLLHNPKHPYFYSVGLVGISVGPNRIQTGSELGRVDRSGNGGMVVDSGTTFTMLPRRIYLELVHEFDQEMRRVGFMPTVQVEDQTGLRPCYDYSDRRVSRLVPGLVLHFAGNASVSLPRKNYFMGFESGGKRVGCLTVMDGGGDDGDESGPAGTLGNFQQQGFEVVYDLEKNRVGFVRRRCSSVWDEMAHV